MRLAVYHNHPSGGAARAIHVAGQQLAQRHDIDVYTLTTADERLLRSDDYARAVYRFEYEPARPVRRGLYLNEWLEHEALRRLDRAGARVAREIDAAGYDAVLVSACRYAQAPPVLRYLRTPSAYYCHEPPRRFLDPFCRPSAHDGGVWPRARRLVHRPARAVVDRAWRSLDRDAVRAATLVLTNSRYMRGRIREYYGHDAAVCYPGIDAGASGEATRDGDYVLAVGAVEHHKGHEFLVRALGRMDPTSRPRLLIVGNAANEALVERLRRLAGEIGVRCEVRVGVDERALEEAYRHARAFVYASLLEPFGLAPVEAMAHGLPVVAVGEGGVLESVRHEETGLLTPRSGDAFASALSRVLTDEAFAARLGGRGREVARERWSAESAARRIEAHLNALASTRQAAKPVPVTGA